MNELLEFSWPYGGGGFSFDIGGQMRGGEFERQLFVAEVKKYRNESNLPTHFRDFLAKCYVALLTKRSRCDHMMWISWAPFQAKKWDQHATPESIKRAILDRKTEVFGCDTEQEAIGKIDQEVLVETSKRIWLITLCEKQERLVISDDHLDQLATIMSQEGRRLNRA
ncbi:hypothetical protein ABN034_12890 [Actinopolymorpha sp. B11F2]|uniref:hypothetical protein n=1 Tax=Actinopolymorpha sp. B11F2 TaxID=3160862 RepID=UPI0032E3ED47